jgi:transposase
MHWMTFQGVEFTPEMRKLIINVKQFFDKNKNVPELLLNKSSTLLTASALGISESTVKIIMAAFNKNGSDGLLWSKATHRGRPAFSVEAGIETIVRKFVRDANKNGAQVTIDIISKYLLETLDCKIASSTLWRTLVRWGFEFGTGTRSAHLKESERIIIQRRRYLREKLSNRTSDGKTIRPEIYLDESYINKNHSRDDTWYFGEDGAILSKPTGKGERLIIVNAINENGWVPNSKLVFQANKKSDDYHTNMNWTVFSTWFKERLLPNIPENSLIIFDNAPYHNVLAENTFPKKTHSINYFQKWLTHNDIPWRKDMLRSELYELCARLAPKPEFLIDHIAFEHGHSILRTPPYHPELQPIEICWAVVKNHVAVHNDFTMKRVKELLEEGFQKISAHTIDEMMKKIQHQEDVYWIEDANFCDSSNPPEDKDAYAA